MVPMPPLDRAQFIPPPYARHMCLHLPAAVRYYRECSGAGLWPCDTLSLVGALHYVQGCGSHQIQFRGTGMAPTSLTLPEHHRVALLPSLHNRVSIAATDLARGSILLLAAAYQPRHLRKWGGACPAPSLTPLLASCVNNPQFAIQPQAIPRSRTTLSPTLTLLP